MIPIDFATASGSSSSSSVWLIVFSVAILVLVGVIFALIIRRHDAKAIVGSRNEASTEKVKAEVILSSIEDGVVMIDSKNTIQVFNNGASRLIGWKKEDAEGLDYHSVLQLIDTKGRAYDQEHEPFARVMSEQKPFRDNQAVIMTKANRQIPIHLIVTPIIDSKNAVNAVVGVFRDVTQERADEEQRADFISTASHEMRTPVAAIEGYLALALNPHVANIDGRARDYLEKAHTSTKHLGQLFQDLLTSAKAEDGRLVNHPQVVEFGALLEQITDSLRFTAEKKGLTVEFLIGSGGNETKTTAAGEKVIRPLYYAQADPDRMREAITNLFDNGVKYTDHGKISVGLTGDDKVIQLYVRDTGAGIAAEDLPHLFQKFYRVDNSTTRSINGTGLGLFISRSIVELSQGRIWVESQLGEGTTFYINLPRLNTQQASNLQTKESKSFSPLTT
ncbi:MAG TPA: ATP-binding protein [Candidatus Saccharimonadales bacterium]|nr:ATP-binding protein [Candidatus Saccharimonadales bacterium]